jgi:hypothetical protein
MESVDIFYGLLVYFMVIWYIFPFFGMLYEEKSGNTDPSMHIVSYEDMSLKYMSIICVIH